MKYFIAALSILIISTSLYSEDFSQNNINAIKSPVLILNDKTTDGKYSGTFIEYFEDKKGTSDINDIASGRYNNAFVLSGKDVLSFGFNTNPFWLRFTVDNKEKIDALFYMEIGYPLLDEIKLYVPDGKGRFIVHTEGDKKLYKERDFDHHNFIFTLHQKPGQCTYYMRIHTTSSVNLPICLYNQKNLNYKLIAEYLLFGIYYGILFVMIMYNLFIYFGSRDNDYLIYVLFLIVYAAFTLSLNGLGYKFFWPGAQRLTDSPSFFMPITNMMGFIFSMVYLNTKEKAPIWHKICIFMIGVYIIIASTSYIVPYEKSIKFATLGQFIGTLMLLALGIQYLIRGQRAAYFFFPSWAVLMIGVGATTLKNSGSLPNNFWTTWGFQLGSIVQIILFSLGLADKLNYLKNRLHDMNLNLEKKVDERTEEVQAAMEELKAINEQLVDTRDALWGEMELAKKIQTVLLPQKPQVSGYEVLGYMKTADEVGGDYYDIITIEGRDWFVIGDVSGHGVTAGLIMMMVQTAIHVAIKNNPRMHPSVLLENVNHTIAENIKSLGENKYMTITVIASQKEGAFEFSGLHQDIFIYRAAKNEVQEIETEGIWLGIMDDISGMLDNKTVVLNKDDVMLLYTDGITEALYKGSNDENPERKGKMYGAERLMELLNSNGQKPIEEIKKEILRDLEGCETIDDITFVILKKN